MATPFCAPPLEYQAEAWFLVVDVGHGDAEGGGDFLFERVGEGDPGDLEGWVECLDGLVDGVFAGTFAAC